jgi:4-hydroxythreonine-4-phosphate dehydrogenase
VKNKPLILVLGEPYSTFSEILIKVFKFQIIKKFKRPIVIIGSLELLKKQMFKLNYSIEINPIKIRDIDRTKINNNSLNIIDVKFNFKKIFDKISSRSNNYIRKSFNIALHLLKKKLACGLINGPISKKHFLKKKYLGITEYLSKKTQLKKNGVMLIYNPFFSVCPVTTHLPISYVSRSLSSKKIIYNILEINKFFITNLNKKPFFAVLGLNPHCETINNYSEENSIIKPAIKSLLKKKIKISGPFSADTFFSKNNLKKYDVTVGMYHDQVLAPMKTLYNFNAINITIGLPFIRVSPDHGTNNKMIGKNKSDPQSLISSINFFKKLK